MKKIFWIVLLLCETALADPMQAHHFANKGPWFEGWYTRLTDSQNKVSLAVISTSALHAGQKYNGTTAPGYVAIVVDSENGAPALAFEDYPQNISLENRGDDFLWQAPAYGAVSKQKTDIQIGSQAHVQFAVQTRKAWAASEVGPEGLLAKLFFLPLRWFVYNTAGLAHYTIDYMSDGSEVHLEGEGFLHQEKNWGQTFPTSWVWAQAVGSDGQSSLDLAGGDLNLGPLKAHSYMIGYRSAQLAVDFNVGQGPLTSFRDQINSCQNEFNLVAKNERYQLRISAKAAPATFAKLSVPTAVGYTPNGAMESFKTLIKTELYLASGTPLKPAYELLETQIFEQAALEFGGTAMDCRH